MTIQSLNYIKTRFETGDRPNGQDFSDLIETLASNATALGLVSNNDIDHTVFGIENATVIDSFQDSEWRMVKYVLSLSNVSQGINKVYSTEITILIDSNDVNVSQYGMIDNDGDVGTVDVSKSNGVISLIVTPTSALTPVTVRFYRTGLKA